MSYRYDKKGKAEHHTCECGNRATQRRNSAWQCDRCAAIIPDHYHGMRAGIKARAGMSVNAFLAEYKRNNV